MKTQCFKLILLVAALALTACNNDIFIEDIQPSGNDFTVGTGEMKSVSFGTEYLRSIQLQLDRFQYDWTIFGENYSNTYNSRSSLYLMDVSSSLPFINRVMAVNSQIEVEFLQEKTGHLTIKTLSNISGESISGRIKLTYTYKEEYIRFVISREIEEGKYIITGLTYDNTNFSNDFRSITTTPLTINNNSPKPMTQSFCPENWCMIQGKFETEHLYNFDIDPDQEYPEVEIPTFVNKENESVIAGALNGTKVRYTTNPFAIKPLDSGSVNGNSFYAVYPIEIPPYTTVKGVLNLQRIFITAKATLHIENPVSGRTHDLPTTVEITQPFFYTFKWQEIQPDEN